MLSAVLMLGSCSKSNDDSKPKEESCKVESMQRKGEAEKTSSFTYDDKGRIQKLDYNGDESFGYTKTFTYQTNKIVADYKYIGNNDTYNETYNLDAGGRIASIVLPDEGLTTSFSYNSEGYLSKIVLTNNDSSDPYTETSTFTYSDGNLVKIVTVSEDSGSSSTWTENISYSDQSSRESLVQAVAVTRLLESSHFGVGYYEIINLFGKPSKNLISKVEHAGSFPHTDTYTYQKDAKGNIISVKENSETFGATTYNFTYSCK